jgi:glutamine amidotransferase
MTGTAGIVDFGLCNLDSIARAVERCGWKARISRDRGSLGQVDKIILPGVGAFARAMDNLRQAGLDREIRDERDRRAVPLLGICLGMHLLADRGDEGGVTDGLGLIPGDVRQMTPSAAGERWPHIGWNEVHPETAHPILRGIEQGADFYFVHGYHFVPRSSASIVATTPYCGGFVSVAAAGDDVMGVQFHPEKSLGMGATVLRNFLDL